MPIDVEGGADLAVVNTPAEFHMEVLKPQVFTQANTGAVRSETASVITNKCAWACGNPVILVV